MATYTSNYGWTKPSGSDNVDISVLNDNLDDQDSTIHDAFLNMAPPFSESSTYAVDDIVLYGTGLYKCHTAVVTPGSWTGSTNWQVYKLSEGGSGGGGTSNYNQLTNKPSINSVTLSGNKTSADLGLQDAIQIDTMPTASATYDGKIVQYVGTTTASYTHGYYYECINNGGTYSWTQLNVQPSSGGGTSDYADLTNKPQINGVTLSGNKSTSDLGINAAAVGLGNVPNVSTNDQEPTFTEASTRNNIASGEKLSVIFGKIQKFFNDLKTVAFSGSYADLTSKPQVNGVELSGNKTASQLGMANSNTFQGTIAEWNQLSTAEKKAYDHASIPDSIDGGVTFPANQVIMTGGGDVEDAIDGVANRLITPSGTHLLLGYGAINGTNIVSVSLGNNNISDYDFLWVGTAYYNQGVATYGDALIPTILMRDMFTVDAGACFISRDSTNAGVTAINVRYNSTTNTIDFMPTGTPNGNFYYVDGVKIRTVS